MSRQYWAELISWATADGTAVNTTTTETIIFPNVTIPANYMQDGRVLRLTAYGRWGNVITTVPTFIWALRWGGVSGTQIAASGAIISPAAATTAAQWQMDSIIQTRSNGSAGTVFTQGTITMMEDTVATFGTVANYGLVQPMGSAGVTTPAAVTVYLTADTALSFTIDFSASDAANAVTGHIYLLESLN